MKIIPFLVPLCMLWVGCVKKGSTPDPQPPAPVNFSINNWVIDNVVSQNTQFNVSITPVTKFRFNAAIDRNTVAANITFKTNAGAAVPCNVNYENGDSIVVLQPSSPLGYLSRYIVSVATTLKSKNGGHLLSGNDITLMTIIDSSRKFPVISDDALLDLVEQQTFKYFWDFGHPVSGLARERNTSGDIVTSGGSGFGIMTIPTAISRNFITRAQGLARMQTIVAFLKNTAVKVKGAFPHWLNGNTGAIVPFSTNDNGADLVETSYLMMGLLTARQYFNLADASETTLRSDINTLYNNVEWDWFRQGGQNVLYWHYSNDKGWIMNMPIRGWNECLITYVLAASSTTHGIPASVYTNGWKGGTGFVNGNSYYGYTLPLGPSFGGPLFFEHYSFLGINPTGLADASANYATQTKNHTLINYNYCKANPNNYFGYSDSVWGLTASDIQNGYTASSPTNDVGVIAPTAAISSIPYTPAESMKALKFFYYVLGDKVWGEYGFKDAFSLKDAWFANSYLAIDQGPIMLMIENYRTGLLWNLFTSCPEVKTGMLTLGFTAPYL
ncbi:MAG: Ig-like domain-containing protein [Chitinophagaceae bacterium]|nr:Ig-like domain-containing protein [Chitinophagaceae bacterium]